MSANDFMIDKYEFAKQLGEFCDRHQISYRKLSTICDGSRNNFSKTSVARIMNAQGDEALYNRILPLLAERLSRYLEQTLSMDPAQIQAELSPIFDIKESNMIANRCPLSPEACQHFGLKRDPFDVDHLPWGEEIFTNAALDAAAARLRDAVLYQRFVAVVGGVGTGKTLLKLRVASELDGEDGKAKLLYPEFFDMGEVTVHGIANKILAELGQKVPQNKEARVAKIREVLTQMQQEGIGVAIVLDEAHRLADKVISSLKNFWEMTNGKNSRLLGVIVFGQPQFVDGRLRDVRFKEIRQRVQVIQMPEIRDSAVEYLRHRISLVGGDADQLFEPEALKRIAINGTTPLALGNLANGALMDAFAEEETQVTASLNFFRSLSTGQQVLGMRRSAA